MGIKVFLLLIFIILFGCSSNPEVKKNSHSSSSNILPESKSINDNIVKIKKSYEYEEIEGAIWIEAIGESILEGSKTIEEAESEALNRARLKAVETAYGLEINSKVIVNNSVLLSNFIRSKSSGKIIREKILDNITSTIQNEERTLLIYRVRAAFALKEDRKAIKKTLFNITSKINVNNFIEGEKVKLKIIPSEDSYIYIFNLYGKDSVEIIYPNEYSMENSLKSGEILEFPKAGLEFILSCPEGINYSNEFFYVLALKEKYDFKKMVGLKTSFVRLNEIISEIPSEKYAEDYIPYSIRKAERRKDE